MSCHAGCRYYVSLAEKFPHFPQPQREKRIFESRNMRARRLTPYVAEIVRNFLANPIKTTLGLGFKIFYIRANRINDKNEQTTTTKNPFRCDLTCACFCMSTTSTQTRPTHPHTHDNGLLKRHSNSRTGINVKLNNRE